MGVLIPGLCRLDGSACPHIDLSGNLSATFENSLFVNPQSNSVFCFFLWNPNFVCELEAKFHNPRTIPSVRKVNTGRREEKNAVKSGHYVLPAVRFARTNLNKCAS